MLYACSAGYENCDPMVTICAITPELAQEAMRIFLDAEGEVAEEKGETLWHTPPMAYTPKSIFGDKFPLYREELAEFGYVTLGY